MTPPATSPTTDSMPRTLGELRASGYRPRTVKQELRANLIAFIRAGENPFPGIVGYERTVIPQMQNAILSGHDFILLGLRGQAKTRLLRALDGLLDEAVPAIEGSPLREDPFAPITSSARERIAREGDQLPIEWLTRADRYREKLATPDVTISDLIGDIDPIKAARDRKSLDDPDVIHYGIIPRTNRGIFAINELPDLQARIQVGLLNLLEEGDIQIRGFPVRLPLDICLVFSANPEDYTNRGNIITPLRDRISSQILTHYPRTLEQSMEITKQEAWAERGGLPVHVPDYLQELVEEVGFQARSSELVDQNSGVSARMTISLFESVLSNAERRALLTGAKQACVRVSDFFTSASAITGKVELVYEGEREGPRNVALGLVGRAVRAVFERIVPEDERPQAGSEGKPSDFQLILTWFGGQHTLELSDDLSDEELYERLYRISNLESLAKRYLAPEGSAQLATAMEFLVEALHQLGFLAKEDLSGERIYRDVFEEMAKSFQL
jgi:magnesium chelatase subunit I